MLEIRTDEAATGKGIVNLLPCRVQHTGPTGPSSAYWNPSVDESEYDDAPSIGYCFESKLVLFTSQMTSRPPTFVAGGSRERRHHCPQITEALSFSGKTMRRKPPSSQTSS